MTHKIINKKIFLKSSKNTKKIISVALKYEMKITFPPKI